MPGRQSISDMQAGARLWVREIQAHSPKRADAVTRQPSSVDGVDSRSFCSKQAPCFTWSLDR